MIISKYVMSKIMSGLGSKKSEAKAASSRENGKKGGRPPGCENTAPGDPIPWMPHEEITEKVKVNPVTNCWEWQGGLNAGGYGFLFWPMGDMMPRKGRAKSFLAHRVSYTIFRGAIPIFLHIDHLCSVRNCVNPQHLEAVTPSENARRAQAKKRAANLLTK